MIAAKNGITNDRRAELENKLQNNAPSVSAPNESQQAVRNITDTIAKVTGTTDWENANPVGAQFNRLGVSALRLSGKALELSNYFNERIDDAIRYVAPDSVDELLNQTDKINRENAQALQNASSAVTSEDTFVDTRAAQLGQEIPVTEDLANKAMYFPEGIPNAVDSAIRGDFKDDDGTYSDKVGKIIGGLNPIGDARDIVANGKNIYEGKRGAWAGLIGAVVGIVPLIGDGGKIVFKLEREAITEGTEKLVKQGVEKEAAEKLAKEEVGKLVKEAAEKQYDEIAKSGHAVHRHGESITERQLDERAIYGKDPVTGTTDDAFRKNPDGTPATHAYSKDATKFVNKDALVKAEIYIKNTQKYNDALSEAVAKSRPDFVVKDIKLPCVQLNCQPKELTEVVCYQFAGSKRYQPYDF